MSCRKFGVKSASPKCEVYRTLWKQNSNPQNPYTYRGISIGSLMVNVLMSIVLTRLSQLYEMQLPMNQFGIRSDNGM